MSRLDTAKALKVNTRLFQLHFGIKTPIKNSSYKYYTTYFLVETFKNKIVIKKPFSKCRAMEKGGRSTLNI